MSLLIITERTGRLAMVPTCRYVVEERERAVSRLSASVKGCWAKGDDLFPTCFEVLEPRKLVEHVDARACLQSGAEPESRTQINCISLLGATDSVIISPGCN